MNHLAASIQSRLIAKLGRAMVPAMFIGVFALSSFAQSKPGPIVLTGADRRPANSLNGDWASIVDPYFSNLYSFHHEEKKNGWFLNQKAKPGDPFPTEYDFSKAAEAEGSWRLQHPARIALLL